MEGEKRGANGRDIRRSWLLVPLSDPELVEGAWSYGADVVVLDLMELVPEGDRSMARERARDAVATAGRGGADVFAQVDKQQLDSDLRACVWSGLSGIIIPRLESAQQLGEADQLLSQLEEQRGLPHGSLQVVPSLETARGNLAAMDIARSSTRLWGITLGRADLVMDLRPEPSGEIHMMTYLMQRLVIIANAVGLVPLGGWWRAPARGLLGSANDSHEAAFRGRRIGFKGSLCIRPDQVEPLNRGFTPTAGEVAEAHRLIDAHSGQESDAATVATDGTHIALPAVKAARALISLANACAAKDAEKARTLAQVPHGPIHEEEQE